MTLLQHGLVVESETVDLLAIRTNAPAPKGTAGKAIDATLSDAEEGESTEEPAETIEEYKGRLETWVRVCLARNKGMDRDEYKRSGIVFDRRKKVVHEFLKSLNKKKCQRCGA